MLYKKRWEVELFFKWMKQHLKIKSFWGTTINAVKVQIYCAIIACYDEGNVSWCDHKSGYFITNTGYWTISFSSLPNLDPIRCVCLVADVDMGDRCICSFSIHKTKIGYYGVFHLGALGHSECGFGQLVWKFFWNVNSILTKRGITMRKTGIVLLSCLMLSSVLSAETLTLDKCVEIALERNSDVIMGELQAEMAGKDVTSALSYFLPSASAEVGYTHSVKGPSSEVYITSDGVAVPLQSEELKSWNSASGISVQQSIFNAKSIYGYKSYKNMKKSADFSASDIRQTVIYRVKERYYNLLKAEKLLQVQQETVKSSEESFKKAETLYEVGNAPKSDVLNARVQMESDKLLLIEAENNLSIAEASLNHVLGFDIDHDIEVVNNLEVSEIEMEYKDVMDNAYSNHPSLMKSKYNLEAAKAGVGAAYGDFLPSVSAYYGYNWRNKDFNRISDMFDKDYNWYLGVNLSVPLFQGFSRFARVSKAKLERLSSEQAYDQARRDILFEAKQAYFELQQAKKKIAVTTNSIDYAEENLRLNKEKYSLGAGTMLDLITAQVSEAKAKSDHIQSLYAYKLAVARVQKAMGKLEK